MNRQFWELQRSAHFTEINLGVNTYVLECAPFSHRAKSHVTRPP